MCVHECASAALTVKLNWGSGEKQSNASARSEDEEEEVAGSEELNTPRTLHTMQCKPVEKEAERKREGEQRKLTERLRDREIDGM